MEKTTRTNYHLGREREYQVARELLKQGCHTVFRSAGSHSPVDVVGVSRALVRFVQVKAKTGERAGLKNLVEFARLMPAGAQLELWAKQERGRGWKIAVLPK